MTSSNDAQVAHPASDGQQDEVRVRIRLKSGKLAERSITRSFPKAKATKLVSELERLLSEPTTRTTPTTSISDPAHASVFEQSSDESTRSDGAWSLLPGGNGIFTTLLVDDSILNAFVQVVETEADSVQHHPHLAKSWSSESRSWIVGVLCTTHQPAGLSMRDVRLADKIDAIVQSMRPNVGYARSSRNINDAIELLRAENVKAAESAIANPGSKCALHVQLIEDKSPM